MVQTVEEAQQALLTGRPIKLILNSLTGELPLYLIPNDPIENETRKGLLICLEGRGAYFYDGKTELKALNFLKHGFTPLDAGRIIAILQEIFPKQDPVRVTGKQDKPLQLTYEHSTRKNADGGSSPDPKPRATKPKPKSSSKRRHTPPFADGRRHLGRSRKAGSGGGAAA